MRPSITFCSEGFKLDGDLFLPGDLRFGERLGIVLAHGYTGVKDLYLPDNARVLNDAGYVVLTFDYKGWGKSEGPRSRFAPIGRVADLQAAITVLGLQAQVDQDSIAIYGTSYGGATVVRGHRHTCQVRRLMRRLRAWRPLDALGAPARRMARTPRPSQSRPREARQRR